MFQTTGLFLANLNAPGHVVVNQGGTWSSKTYSIMQVFARLAIKDPGSVFTVVGESIPNLKVGAMRDFEDIISGSPDLEKVITAHNISERTYRFFNKSVIEFKSYTTEQGAKSGKRDYLFVNEANGIPKPVYDQLALRTRKKQYLDYNPSAEFWVHQHLIGKPGTSLLISDHRCNPFVEQHQREKIEALKQQDEEMWKVYARGLTGKIEGLVFRNWKVGDHILTNEPFYGLDFGYNDPTGLVEMRVSGNRIELRELIYQSQMITSGIVRKLADLGISRTAYIYGDSSRPEAIEELYQAGYNCHKQYKPQNSVIDGINKLKDFEIVVHPDSINLKKELMTYKWKQDKNGKTLDEPVDFMNHLVDPVRAGLFTKLNKVEYDISW